MRYRARWSNGCWKVFDCSRFADVAKCSTQRNAEAAALDFNMTDAKPRHFAGKRR